MMSLYAVKEAQKLEKVKVSDPNNNNKTGGHVLTGFYLRKPVKINGQPASSAVKFFKTRNMM